MRHRCEARFLAVAACAAFLLTVPVSVAWSANKEHLQLMADLRMLQEQTQQLQVTLNALTEVLKVVSARMDDQAGVTRKAFADQKILIDTLTGDVRVVREKLDETNVRLSSLSQEVDAVRQTAAAAAAAAAVRPAPSEELPPANPDAPLQPVAPPPAVATGMSPQRLYDTAYADYSAGQWSLAIQGFEAFIKSFPRAEQADDAQLYIGESYLLDNKLEPAVAAYDKVIANYPTGDATPMAYYKRGLVHDKLGRAERARDSWQAVIQKFPNSDAALLAKQGLDRLARSNR